MGKIQTYRILSKTALIWLQKKIKGGVLGWWGGGEGSLVTKMAWGRRNHVILKKDLEICREIVETGLDSLHTITKFSIKTAWLQFFF